MDDFAVGALVVLFILYCELSLLDKGICTQELTDIHTILKGNNGLSGFNFGPSQFQNLLFLAGYDPAQPPFTAPCGSGTGCVLPFLGKTRDSELSKDFI